MNRTDDVADAIGCLGLSFFAPMLAEEVFRKHADKGRADCAAGGFHRPPYISRMSPLEFAYVVGWRLELNAHHGTAFRTYDEARAFDFDG